MKTWMNNITPTKIKMLKRRLERDGVTGRVDADTIISMLRNGIQRLERTCERPAGTKSKRSSNEPGNRRPEATFL